MKYKTFSRLAKSAAALGAVGLLVLAYRCSGSSTNSSANGAGQPTPSTHAPSSSASPTGPVSVGGVPVTNGGTAAAPAAPIAPPAPVPPGGQALRSFDRSVLALGERRLSSDKAKDALPGPVKVNLYQDAGASQVNRLKVDLDRDDKWDEKWTFDRDTGVVKRQVAPADDENYSVEFVYREGAWHPAR